MKAVRHYTLITVLASLGLWGCATPERGFEPESVAQSERILLAEMARARGDVGKALSYYARAVPESTSESLAREATLYAMRARAWPEALVTARRWQALAPESPQAQWYAGRTELLVGNLADSERAFRRWLAAGGGEDWGPLFHQLQSEPRQWRAWRLARRLVAQGDDAAAWEALSRFALTLNRLADAHRYADRALARSPERRSAEWLVLRARVGQGEETALADARLLASTGDVSDGLEFVTLLWTLDRGQEALAFVQSQIDELGEEAPLLYTRALLLASLDRHQAAMADLRHLMGQGFRVREAWFQMALVAHQAGEYEAALNWFDRIRSGEDELAARIGGIAMLLELGRPSEAWERVDELGEQLREAAGEFHLELAPALASRSHLDEAARLCRELLASPAGNAESYYRCGLALLQADRDNAQGLAWLREAQARWPDEPALLNALGYSLADQGRELRQARRLIRRALDKSPDSGAILDSLGWVEYRLGNERKALTLLERAWRRYPSPEVAAHLVELRWVVGDEDGARSLYQEASDRWPDEDMLRETWQRLTGN